VISNFASFGFVSSIYYNVASNPGPSILLKIFIYYSVAFNLCLKLYQCSVATSRCTLAAPPSCSWGAGRRIRTFESSTSSPSSRSCWASEGCDARCLPLPLEQRCA